MSIDVGIGESRGGGGGEGAEGGWGMLGQETPIYFLPVLKVIPTDYQKILPMN